MAARPLFALLSLASWAVCSAVAEEAAKPRPEGIILDISKEAMDHVTVESTGDEYGVTKTTFTIHEGYAAETVADGSKMISMFNLEFKSPRRVEKYVVGDRMFVVITVEPALCLSFEKDSGWWVGIPIYYFYEQVLFKGLEGIVIDLEKFADGSLFSAAEFGSGKKHVFKAPGKRILKVVYDENVPLIASEGVVLGLTVYANGEKKIAQVIYIHKEWETRRESRIKEVFFQKTEEDWVKVDAKAAATVLHDMNPEFPADYKTVYDGFSVSGVFLAITTILAVALFC
ncbi:ema family member protein [Theileria equi strain WA]|uniref:Ema family member protein n=1 Tax=Theileria equi strain WA TaxID=1537102 RepID=L0AWK7_THEEQ|nr:ema family member protein [Theileria equi strain WA]AFZ79972.1 ema family member protein [Theileria equi strain WA]|eukprot:XP_004829638.1 ema family member protein [Theileria equi strain WA]